MPGVRIDLSDVLSPADVAARLEQAFRALPGGLRRLVSKELAGISITTLLGLSLTPTLQQTFGAMRRGQQGIREIRLGGRHWKSTTVLATTSRPKAAMRGSRLPCSSLSTTACIIQMPL